MSLQSWLKEFYPPLSKATRSWLEAIEHSTLKWTGARPKNLKKHEVALLGPSKEEALPFNSSTCALCQVALKAREQAVLMGKEPSISLKTETSRCGFCPLAAAQDGKGCEAEGSAFHTYCQTGSPEAMLKALAKARKMVEANPRWEQALKKRV
jgi:hypothetical protein